MDLITFWTTYGSAVANGAVVLSAIAAFAVIYSARGMARRQGTLELIMRIESDRELIDARAKYIDLKASATKLETYGAVTERKSDQAKTIRKILNIHELTAVAIQEGVIDERVFRRWFNKAYTDDHTTCQRYIEAVQKATGKSATLDGDGRTFAEVAATRGQAQEGP